MSSLTPPNKIFLFASFLFRKDKIEAKQLQKIWKDRFDNSVVFRSDFCPMKNYYSPEMGDIEKLDRFFILSHDLRDREELVRQKLWADALEKEQFLEDGKRFVNIDIGVLSLENLQLATGKNFTHRVYVGNNIYSDLTLIFQGKSFQKLPWSYPDYSSAEVVEFFNWSRKLLHQKLLKEG